MAIFQGSRFCRSYRGFPRRLAWATLVGLTIAGFSAGASGASDTATLSELRAPAAAPDPIDAPASAGSAATRSLPPIDPRYPIAVGLDPLPPQPPGVPFPTIEWPTGPLPGGVSKKALDDAVNDAFGFSLNPFSVRSLVVVHGGKIVYERYKGFDDTETTYASFSVAKSFTSAMVGMLVGDGKLDPFAPAPVSQWATPGDKRAAITINDLLHMAGGQRWNESYDDGASSVFELLLARNGPAYAAQQPYESPAGAEFVYSTGTSALLAGIASDAVGGPAGRTYLQQRLLDPLGITSSEVQLDPSGYFRGGLGVDSTSRDFARFGLLYLRDGVWDGVRLLPRGWVDYSRSPSAASAGYGAHWWLDNQRGLFRAAGLFGQYIVVVPKLDLVYVINSTDRDDSYPLLTDVYDAFVAGLPQ
jgi:CubicO group peptidase (beta-lactamase class C family)